VLLKVWMPCLPAPERVGCGLCELRPVGRCLGGLLMGWVVVATTPDGVDRISVLICDGCGRDATHEGHTLTHDDRRLCRTCRPFPSDARGVV